MAANRELREKRLWIAGTVAPALVLLGAVAYLPIIYAIFLSFRSQNRIFTGNILGGAEELPMAFGRTEHVGLPCPFDCVYGRFGFGSSCRGFDPGSVAQQVLPRSGRRP